jgi:hypothetical protein
MKKNQIALGTLFVALPFFVIAFLTKEVGQSAEAPEELSKPVYISSCTGKSRDVLIEENHNLIAP